MRGDIDDVAACTHGAGSLAGTVNPCFVETRDPDSIGWACENQVRICCTDETRECCLALSQSATCKQSHATH